MILPIPRSVAVTLILSLIATGGGTAAARAASPARVSTPGEQAAFLAGLPLPKRSVLAPLQRSRDYRAHQQDLQEEWAFCRKVRFDAMRQWSLDHLAPYDSARGVVRYLFGGPDFLNVCAFFPEARVTVLGGLEPVGEVPPPENLDPAALGSALQTLRQALHTSLYCGYFITSEMKPQLAQGTFRGVLPVLYTELALTGHVIRSVTPISPFGAPGVQIDYARAGGRPQTLYYFQADLSNGKECGRFLDWMDGLGPGASYLKAASYLLPLDAFSQTRRFLLKTSTLILQDDSGIPFRDFSPSDWNMRLFGVYEEPLEIFRRHREPELAEAYTTAAYAGPLPFGAGYHVRPEHANLLLAVRRTDTSPEGVPTPRPSPVRIRKALPVEIRKALPVHTPHPKRPRKGEGVPTPSTAPDPVSPEVIPPPASPPPPLPAEISPDLPPPDTLAEAPRSPDPATETTPAPAAPSATVPPEEE